MPLYVFGCSQGHRSELIRPLGTDLADCATCGQSCGRVYGYSMAITQPETDVRGMTRRFVEATEELHARGHDTSDIYTQAQRHAQAVMAAGEAPSLRRQW